jgi:hypothetical protein
MQKNNRMVIPRPDGMWAIQESDGPHPLSLHPTQFEAREVAREMLRHSGGGELMTKSTNQHIWSLDTIAPAPMQVAL